MPDKKAETSQKSERERRFIPKKLFENDTRESQNSALEKITNILALESHKVPEKNMALFFVQGYFA